MSSLPRACLTFQESVTLILKHIRIVTKVAYNGCVGPKRQSLRHTVAREYRRCGWYVLKSSPNLSVVALMMDSEKEIGFVSHIRKPEHEKLHRLRILSLLAVCSATGINQHHNTTRDGDLTELMIEWDLSSFI